MFNTRIFFSYNVADREEVSRIGSTFGFRIFNNLDMYLGVPLLHDKITKDTYKYILDNARKSLFGWKTTSLSMAGKLTLVKSVLVAIPAYAM